jgi:hypothetical protein
MRRAAVLLLFGCGILCGTCTKTWVLAPDSTSAGGQSGGSGVGGHGFPGNGGSGGRQACNIMQVNSQERMADLILAVGRDASMQSRFADTTRMAAVQAALNDAVMGNQNLVNFGYQDFPALGACAGGASCCISSEQVTPSPYSYPLIEQDLAQCAPGSGPPQSGCVAPTDSRPLTQALMSASTVFNSLQSGPQGDTNDHYVMLLVDGTAGCVGEDPDDACTSALAALSTLGRASVKTYVVAIGEDAENDMCLQQLALAGGAANPVTPFVVQARDPTQLTKNIGKIIAAIAPSCIIDLKTVPSDISEISVYVQSHQIPHDASQTNGWSFFPASNVEIQVFGPACQTVQAAAPNDVRVYAGCPPCGENFPCP